MRLEYSVLAIDDQPDSAETFAASIGDYLATEGFDLIWKTCATQADLEAHLRTLGRSRPDVVVVDNKLGESFGGDDGPHWASMVRRMFPYTDIVFYGQDAAVELRQKIAEAAVDGVYCSYRPSLVEHLRDLIAVHVRRWTDAPAMRGLAVGIAAELDDILRAACIEVASHHEKKVREFVYTKVTNDVNDRSKRRPKVIGEYIQADDYRQLFHEHQEFGALELAKTIRRLADAIEGQAVEDAKDFFERYKQDVVEPRNVLAHGICDDATGVFTLGDRKFATTEEECRKFRVTLRNYRDQLREIRDAAKQGKVVFRKS
jgi:DNA-binding response OmpR family regulator